MRMSTERSPDLPAGDQAEPDREQRTWGMLAHLSALAGLLTGVGFIGGPLMVWLLQKNEMPFVDDQGKEALNFQITMTLVFCICWLLIFVMIGFLLIPLLTLLDVVLVVVATIKASRGERYRYPFTLRLVG
jgi:uncharacterized Tic20 family protein